MQVPSLQWVARPLKKSKGRHIGLARVTGPWNSFLGASLQAKFQNFMDQKNLGKYSVRVWPQRPGWTYGRRLVWEPLQHIWVTLDHLLSAIMDHSNLSHYQSSGDTCQELQPAIAVGDSLTDSFPKTQAGLASTWYYQMGSPQQAHLLTLPPTSPRAERQEDLSLPDNCLISIRPNLIFFCPVCLSHCSVSWLWNSNFFSEQPRKWAFEQSAQ